MEEGERGESVEGLDEMEEGERGEREKRRREYFENTGMESDKVSRGRGRTFARGALSTVAAAVLREDDVAGVAVQAGHHEHAAAALGEAEAREVNHAVRPAVAERLQPLDEVGDRRRPRFAQGPDNIITTRRVNNDILASGGGRE